MNSPVYFRNIPNEEWERIKDTGSEPFEGVQELMQTKKYKVQYFWKDGAMYIECEEKKSE